MFRAGYQSWHLSTGISSTNAQSPQGKFESTHTLFCRRPTRQILPEGGASRPKCKAAPAPATETPVRSRGKKVKTDTAAPVAGAPALKAKKAAEKKADDEAAKEQQEADEVDALADEPAENGAAANREEKVKKEEGVENEDEEMASGKDEAEFQAKSEADEDEPSDTEKKKRKRPAALSSVRFFTLRTVMVEHTS